MWLYVILLLVLLLLAFWSFFSSKSPNPFSVDVRRPPAPPVTDKDIRKKVLKQAFSADKVPQNLDAIVIGSGFGGLAAAVVLSKAGKRVLVLEQHSRAGGCCHTFSKKGFEFDTGIHYIGRMQTNSPVRILLDQLTEGQLQWAKMPDVFDAVILGEPGNGKTYRLHSGTKEYYEELKKQFPGEDAAIEKFAKLIKTIAHRNAFFPILKLLPLPVAKLLSKTGLLGWFSPFIKMASRSLSEVVNGLTTNEELRAVFCYIFPTYGTLPSNTSFSLHAFLVDHFLKGGWYPSGGASEIAFHTIPIIKRAGGAVLTKAMVQNILLDSEGKAYGVSVMKGQQLVNVFAPIVISDAGIFNTYERLLPEAARALPGIQASLRMVEHGLGGLTVFIGIVGSKEELGLEATNYYIYPESNLEKLMKHYLAASRDEAAKNIPVMYVTSPSAKDPTWEERFPGKSTLIVVSFAQYKWFEEWKDEQASKRGVEYEGLKDTFVNSIMETIFKLYPAIKDKIEYVSAGTPLTNQHYLLASKGEMYGADHGLSRLQAEVIATMRSQTPIPNLYLTESQEEHGDYFVSILSSHGEEGVIYGSEGKPVKLTRIFQTLSPQRSSALAGKSKIFFIQACRGGALDSGVWLETDSAQPEEDSFSHYLALPDNTAVMFACSPGYGAFLNLAGSMFLQTLLELLEGEERHLELARLLTRINWKVAFYCEARGTYKGSKEMPCFVTNMVHEVFPFSQHAAEAAGSL